MKKLGHWLVRHTPPPTAQKGLSDLILSKFITLINIGSDED